MVVVVVVVVMVMAVMMVVMVVRNHAMTALVFVLVAGAPP